MSKGTFKGDCELLWNTWNSRNHEVETTKNIKSFRSMYYSPSDDVQDTYVEIDNNLYFNINIYNALVAKAHIWFDIGHLIFDIFCSSFISKFHVSFKQLEEAIIWIWKHFSWEAFIQSGHHVTLKKQISGKWTQVVPL